MEYDVTEKELNIRIGRYLWVTLQSFHGNAIGGGLLYFGVDADIRK